MTKKFFIIAGEASGDLLGSKLIQEIKAELRAQNEMAEFIGVGGEMMCGEGLRSIFPMADLSVMGFVEVVPHIFKLLKRIKQTADEIILQKPEFIITIDAPDFNFRVMQKIKNYNEAKKIHLIAPSVWAYRAGRAQKIAKLYDLLLAILPFEPPYFEKYNLKTVFIGHPIMENAPDMNMKEAVREHFRKKYGFYVPDNLIYMTPGSRNAEVEKIFPQFIKAVNILSKQVKNLAVVIPVVSKTREKIENLAKNFTVKYVIVAQDEKSDALFASDFALAKSGTNTLEISLYQLPMIVAYRLNVISHAIVKMMVKIKFANLINLIMQREIIPELLQYDCEAKIIARKLGDLIINKEMAQKQVQDSAIALKILGLGAEIKPTKKAVLEILRR